MSFRNPALLLLAATAALSLTAGPAAAQQEAADRHAGGRVYGLVGAGLDDGVFVATGVGAGLRLTRHVGLDVELTHMSGGDEGWSPPWFGGVSIASATAADVLEDYPALGAGVDVPLSFEGGGRDVTTFLTKFTVEFPIADGRLFPYLSGGGGVGRVTERHGVFPIPLIPWGLEPDAAFHFGGFEAFPGPDAYSELGLALALGGGVDVRLWRGFGVGGDIRWLRILRSYDPVDTAQVTARVSYRF